MLVLLLFRTKKCQNPSLADGGEQDRTGRGGGVGRVGGARTRSARDDREDARGERGVQDGEDAEDGEEAGGVRTGEPERGVVYAQARGVV